MTHRREWQELNDSTQKPADSITRLRRFRARVICAFATGEISCDCMGVTHNARCPLGELEIEAEAMREAAREAQDDE